jgi:hypothetical protein
MRGVRVKAASWGFLHHIRFYNKILPNDSNYLHTQQRTQDCLDLTQSSYAVRRLSAKRLGRGGTLGRPTRRSSFSRAYVEAVFQSTCLQRMTTTHDEAARTLSQPPGSTMPRRRSHQRGLHGPSPTHAFSHMRASFTRDAGKNSIAVGRKPLAVKANASSFHFSSPTTAIFSIC